MRTFALVVDSKMSPLYTSPNTRSLQTAMFFKSTLRKIQWLHDTKRGEDVILGFLDELFTKGS